MAATTLYLVSAEETAADCEKRLAVAQRRKNTAWNSLLFAPRFSVVPWGPEFKAIVDKHHQAVRECNAELACVSPLRYWKVGVTKWADPLRRDPTRYREVFRAVVLPDRAAAEYVEWHIARSFCAIDCPVGKEALNGMASLESACALFDQMVEWERSGLLCGLDFDRTVDESERYWREVVFEGDPNVEDALEVHLPLWRRHASLLADVRQSLVEAKTACTASTTKQPMWA